MSCRLLLLLILLVVLVTDKSNTCTKAHCLALVVIDSRRPRRETETDRQRESTQQGKKARRGCRAGGLEGWRGLVSRQASKPSKKAKGKNPQPGCAVREHLGCSRFLSSPTCVTVTVGCDIKRGAERAWPTALKESPACWLASKKGPVSRRPARRSFRNNPIPFFRLRPSAGLEQAKPP